MNGALLGANARNQEMVQTLSFPQTAQEPAMQAFTPWSCTKPTYNLKH